jgi:hypothetical protein
MHRLAILAGSDILRKYSEQSPLIPSIQSDQTILGYAQIFTRIVITSRKKSATATQQREVSTAYPQKTAFCRKYF